MLLPPPSPFCCVLPVVMARSWLSIFYFLNTIYALGVRQKQTALKTGLIHNQANNLFFPFCRRAFSSPPTQPQDPLEKLFVRYIVSSSPGGPGNRNRNSKHHFPKSGPPGVRVYRRWVSRVLAPHIFQVAECVF